MRVAINGLGRIGRGVAKRSKGFEMRILYTDAVRAPAEVERELGAQFVEKETLFREADFVTLHVPLLPETHHYVSSKELKLMKKTAHLINASRGPVVDEVALLHALDRGWIAGAVLDVFRQEPLPPEHPFWRHPKVIITPHIAGAAYPEREVALLAENLRRLQTGRPLKGLVRRSRGY